MGEAKANQNEGLAPLTTGKDFARSSRALSLQIESMKKRAKVYRQAAANYFQDGEEDSAERQIERARMLETSIRAAQNALDALNAKFDILETLELRKTVQDAVISMQTTLTTRQDSLDSQGSVTSLSSENKKLEDMVTNLKKAIDGGTGASDEKITPLEELQRNQDAVDADGSYFKLKNQTSGKFLSVSLNGRTGKKESDVVYGTAMDDESDLLWSKEPKTGTNFKLKHKKTGAWLGPMHGGVMNRDNPVVCQSSHADQSWTVVGESKLKNVEYTSFLVEYKEEPRLRMESKVEGKDEWEFDYDTEAARRAAQREQAAQRAKTLEEAKREQQQELNVEDINAETEKSAEERGGISLEDYAKLTAVKAAEFDKLTAEMTFIGAFYLSNIYPTHSLFLATIRRPNRYVGHGCRHAHSGVDALQLGRVIDSSYAHAEERWLGVQSSQTAVRPDSACHSPGCATRANTGGTRVF